MRAVLAILWLFLWVVVPTSTGAQAAERRTLVFAVDGLSFEAFQTARARGLFSAFTD
jgi:hypothetical protein